MSRERRRRFLPALRELEAGLALPIPDRIRILRELEFDLEELFRSFLDQGVPVEEARDRAVRTLVPDRRSLSRLAALHAPLYRRLTRGLPEDRLRRAERWALVATAGLVLALETLAVSRLEVFSDPSPFLFPVVGLGALMLSLAAANAFRLWIRGDSADPGAPGLGALLALTGAILLVGVLGAVADFHALAGVLEKTPGLASTLLLPWVVRSCGLLAVALLLSLAGGLIWLVLAQWLALASHARMETLGYRGTEEEMTS